MDWYELSKILKRFYYDKGLADWYQLDEKYLSNAFLDIERIWFEQYKKIDKVKYVMLSEAPLWGKSKKYIYNLDVNNSQFFYRSDLEYAINKHINSKFDFIDNLNQLGFIVVDISPFALNPKNTRVNYREITVNDYKMILRDTIPFYFSKKMELINKKRNSFVSVFYRYGRVRDAFNDLIAETIIDKKLIDTKSNILDISQRGGGIDKRKLKEIINSI